MAQHFLLSADARDLSLMKLFNMSDNEAFENFKAVRWSDTDGKPVCPTCGNTNEHYFLRTRKQFRCKECNHTFSVTSGTIFASHKLPLKVYLIAIALFTNAAKSISALQLSRDLDIQYKSAWVLSHKIRESLMENQDESKLSGVCEIDGVYVNGYVRPANNINNRVDRRLSENLNPNKRTVISLRQRADDTSGIVGSVRTKTFVTRGENTSDIKELVYNSVELGSVIHADEHQGYDHFHAHYEMKRVNHSVEYKSKDGACNNQSESFNARFRRMSNGAIFNDIFSKCLSTPVSNEFCGYWQGNKRIAERLGA